MGPKYDELNKPEEWKFIEPIDLPPLAPINLARPTHNTRVAPGRRNLPPLHTWRSRTSTWRR